MPIRKYKPEQIVTLLRQVEVGLADGKSTPQACKEAEITAQPCMWIACAEAACSCKVSTF
jgi:hypothetical protein